MYHRLETVMPGQGCQGHAGSRLIYGYRTSLQGSRTKKSADELNCVVLLLHIIYYDDYSVLFFLRLASCLRQAAAACLSHLRGQGSEELVWTGGLRKHHATLRMRIVHVSRVMFATPLAQLRRG